MDSLQCLGKKRRLEVMNMIMNIGRMIFMSDEDYAKQGVRLTREGAIKMFQMMKKASISSQPKKD